jgi:hypothetical protein
MNLPARMTAEDMARDDLRRGRAPRNFMEAVLAEHQPKRRAEEIAAEERNKKLDIWSPSLNSFVAPSIAERLPSPVLKEVKLKDQSGRTITEFHGDHPSVWLNDFAAPPKRLTGFRTK